MAFVLGGGGARGALQAGALRALIERGILPDLLVGVSAGAVNATFVAIHGLSVETIDRLDAAWRSAAEQDLLPSNYIWLTLRSMLRRSWPSPATRIRDFFVASGVTPHLRFSDLTGLPKLIIVSSDLNTGRPVLHGQSPDESVLEALLVSTALPPWAMPVMKQGHYLMDGAVVSSLPIEPALQAGATEIIALDLSDPRDAVAQINGFDLLLSRLTYGVEQRQVDLELDLARARGVPVRYLRLTAPVLLPMWDFRRTGELIMQGYEVAKRALDDGTAIDTPSTLSGRA